MVSNNTLSYEKSVMMLRIVRSLWRHRRQMYSEEEYIFILKKITSRPFNVKHLSRKLSYIACLGQGSSDLLNLKETELYEHVDHLTVHIGVYLNSK